MRRPISMEKVMHRRSITRKPSFLEIDDDTDRDADGDIDRVDAIVPQTTTIAPAIQTDSFLDFARESFDSACSPD